MRPQRGGPASGHPPSHHRWWRAVRAILRKEIIEIVRDRRTLVAALVLPAVLMPLVVLAMPLLIRQQEAVLRDRPARIAVLGGDAGGLVALGFDMGAFSVTSTPAPRAALLRGEVDVVLVDADRPGARPRKIDVLFDESRPLSRAAVEKVARVAARLALRDLERAARARGLEPAQLVPIVLEPRNVAPARRMGAVVLGTALPFFLAVWLLLGGQYAALDLGVGERERGSLEALLVTPPPRSAIVGGKFLAVLAPAVLALVVMLGAGVTAARLGAPWLSDRPVAVSLTPWAAAGLLVVGAALGGLLSALQLLVSLAAKTLREAQQAFTGLYLLVALPVTFVPFLGDWTGQPWAALVPVVNAALAFREILMGEWSPATLGATIASLVVLTAAALACGVRILEGQRHGPIR